MCYHAEYGRSALKGVSINTGNPMKLGSAGTSLSWDVRRGWHGRQLHASPTCYHVRFGSSATKSVCINRQGLPELGSAGTPPPCGGDVADPLKQAPPHMCYHVKFGCSASMGVY